MWMQTDISQPQNWMLSQTDYPKRLKATWSEALSLSFFKDGDHMLKLELKQIEIRLTKKADY